MGSKKATLKRPVAKKSAESGDEEIAPPIVRKVPVAVDFAEIIDPVLPIEEKAEDEAPTSEDDSELGPEEASLDEEDLNPFGDKWEQ